MAADIGLSLASRAASTASDIMRNSSFHDLSLWEEQPASSRSTDPAAPGEPQPPRVSRNKSARVLRELAPQLLNEEGTALSRSGVAAVSAAGVVCCHSVRLLIREILEAVLVYPRRGHSKDSWRTFELYMLSLLHSGAWIGFGVRRLLQKAGRFDDTGGTVRALCLSAGYHWYILLSLKSIWTHPLVTLQQIGEVEHASYRLDRPRTPHAACSPALSLRLGLSQLLRKRVET